jgi:fumarate reductase subunit D
MTDRSFEPEWNGKPPRAKAHRVHDAIRLRIYQVASAWYFHGLNEARSISADATIGSK